MTDCEARLHKLERENIRLKRALMGLVQLDVMDVNFTLAIHRSKFDEAELGMDEISSLRKKIMRLIALDSEEGESTSD